jgi:hypothetical protein
LLCCFDVRAEIDHQLEADRYSHLQFISGLVSRGRTLISLPCRG